MGIIFMDGFEKNTLSMLYVYTSASIASTSGLDLTGNYCLKVSSFGNYQYARLKVPSILTELYGTMRIRTTGYVEIVFKDSAGTDCMYIGRNTSSGLLELKRGGVSGTLLATGCTILTNTTYHLRFYYKPLNSGGVFQVWIDGDLTIDYSGDTTNGTEDVDSIVFSVGNNSFYIDDIVLSTTDITKNLRIAGKAVTGAGTTTQWDPSAGANYQCVDEVPPVHTDYNSTNVTDEIDTFALADCTEEIDNIAAVQVELSAAYEGSPTPTKVAAVLRCGGTDYAHSTPQSPPSSFGAALAFIWELNPADSAAFEEADINAMEVGYKATA